MGPAPCAPCLQLLRHTQARLESGHYSKHQQVADDVRLVWDNCKNYNQVGSYVIPPYLIRKHLISVNPPQSAVFPHTRQEGSYLYKIAEKLANKFEEKYAKIKNEGTKDVAIHHRSIPLFFQL